MATNSISSKDSEDFGENQIMHLKSANVEVMMGSEADEIIEELFESRLKRYHERLEESKKRKQSCF